MWHLRQKQARLFLGATMLAAAVLLFTGVHEDRSEQSERQLMSYAAKTVGLHYYVKKEAQRVQQEQENETYIVLLTCSAGYFDMFVNWLKHFELLSVPNLSVYMFADTSGNYQQCLALAESSPKKKEYLKCHLWDFAIEHGSSQQDLVGNEYYSTLSPYNHQFMSQQRPAIVQHLLQQQQEGPGYNVIYSDLDVIWKKNPLPHIQKQLHQHDAAQQQDHRDAKDTTTTDNDAEEVASLGPHILACRADGQPSHTHQLSTDFVVYKSHPETLSFVNLWIQEKMPQEIKTTTSVAASSGRTNLSVTFNRLLDQIESDVINYVNVKAETLGERWCGNHLNKMIASSAELQQQRMTFVASSNNRNEDDGEDTLEEEGVLRRKAVPRGRIGGGSWM